MNLNRISFLLFLLVLSEIAKPNSVDTVYSATPELFTNSFRLEKGIKTKIKSRTEYYYIDSNANKIWTTVEITTYDKKRRVTGIKHLGNKYEGDTVSYVIKYKWISDTCIDVKIHYNKNYAKGKGLFHFDEDGRYIETKILSDTQSKKNYFIRVLVKLDRNYRAFCITYFDYLGKPVEVFLPQQSKWNSYKDPEEKCDTIFENGRIKSIRSIIKYANQFINNHWVNGIIHQYDNIYNYDSRNRVVNIQESFKRDSIISSYNRIISYLDTTENVLMFYNVDSEGIGLKYDFFYNSNYELIRSTFDKNVSDSLVDDEYLFNNEIKVHRNRFYRYTSNSTTNIITWEYIESKGLLIEFHMYENGIPDNYGTVYKYKNW